MSGVPSRLRIAVVASGATAQGRLAALVARNGHEVVELTAAPNAILTDGTIDGSAPAPAVAIGSVEGDFAGWVPPDRFIGTTGVTVDPELYIGLGISGAVQHVAGIGHPRHLVAVNTDSSAPLMAMADVAIVTDAVSLLRELAARLADA